MSSTTTTSDQFNPKAYENLPIAYGAFTGLWVVVGLLWIIHVAYFLYFKKCSLSLHRFMILVPLAKIIHTSCSIYLFYDCAYNGKSQCTITPTLLANSANVLFNIVLFGCLLILGKGIAITRNSLENTEKRSIIWNLTCLALCEVARIFNVFFMFPLFILYVILFGHALSSIGMNIKLLNHRYLEVEAPLVLQVDIMKSSTFMKLTLFKKLRFLLFLFLGSYVAIFALTIVFMFVGEISQNFWIQLVASESLQFTVCLLVAFLIRIRDFSEHEQVDLRIETHRRERRANNRANMRMDLNRFIQEYFHNPSGFETSQNSVEETTKFATKLNPITNTECLCLIDNPVSKESNQGKYAVAIQV